MCKILCKLITLYNMKIRLWDCKTYGYGYMAACLQCYYSELSKLSSTPGQTIAAECFHTDIATKVWSWSTHDTRHMSLIPPCRPMLTTTSHSCHRYLLLQSLHAIFGALHSVQTIRSAAFLHSTTLHTWYLYQVSHYNSSGWYLGNMSPGVSLSPPTSAMSASSSSAAITATAAMSPSSCLLTSARPQYTSCLTRSEMDCENIEGQ